MRLEIAVADDMVDAVIDAIVNATRTGEIANGKIFVFPLEEAVRIRTGERGSDAL